MRIRREAALSAAIAVGLAAPLVIAAPAAYADELSNLRANQQLLEQRLDQLAQARVPGNVYGVGGKPGPTNVHMMGGSFPRSFLIPGTNTSIRVGGEIREVFDYWFDGGNPNRSPQNTTVGQNGQALSIPLTNPARARGHSIFQQSPRESKLNIETRTPTALGEARTFMEFDWAGGALSSRPTVVSDSLVPRLRYAYGTLGGVLGGQANSNFSDSDSGTETLDFGGNVGSSGLVRVPQIRYTEPLAPWGVPGALSVSAETPETDVWGGTSATAGTIFASDGTQAGNFTKAAAPDLTAAWYIPQPWGHMDFSTVLRPALQVKDGLFVDRTYTGWGIHWSGDVKPHWFGWNKDYFVWQFTYGVGMGRYLNGSSNFALVTNYNTSAVPKSAAAAANILVKPVSSWGVQAGYRHLWQPNLRSTISGGIMNQDVNSLLVVNSSGRGALSGINKQVITAHVNLIWSPVSFVDVGLEYMWAQRQVVDNQRGDENALISRFRVRF